MKHYKRHSGTHIYTSIRRCADQLVCFTDPTTFWYDGRLTDIATVSHKALETLVKRPVPTLQQFLKESNASSIMFELFGANIGSASLEREFSILYKASGRSVDTDLFVSRSIICLSKLSVLLSNSRLVYRSSVLSPKHGLPALIKVDAIMLPRWQVNSVIVSAWEKLCGVKIISDGAIAFSSINYTNKLYADLER